MSKPYPTSTEVSARAGAVDMDRDNIIKAACDIDRESAQSLDRPLIDSLLSSLLARGDATDLLAFACIKQLSVEIAESSERREAPAEVAEVERAMELVRDYAEFSRIAHFGSASFGLSEHQAQCRADKTLTEIRQFLARARPENV